MTVRGFSSTSLWGSNALFSVPSVRMTSFRCLLRDDLHIVGSCLIISVDREEKAIKES